MTAARLVLLGVKLVAACSSVKVSMWNVCSRGHERGLYWLLPRCSQTVGRLQKRTRKMAELFGGGIDSREEIDL